MISIGSYVCINGGISSHIHMNWIFSSQVNSYPISNYQAVEGKFRNFILNSILIGIRPGVGFQNPISFGSITGTPVWGRAIGIKS